MQVRVLLPVLTKRREDERKRAASIFSQMQATRIELLQMGTKENDHQDILLGQMLEKGKDAMKIKFCELTLNKGR